MKKQKFIIYIFFAIAINSCYSQKLFDTEKIFLGEKKYEYVHQTQDSSRTFGTVSERIEINGNKEDLLVTFTQNLPRINLTDSILLDFETFTPKLYTSFAPKIQDIKVNYNLPGNIIVDLKINDSSLKNDSVKTIKTKESQYDYHWPHILIAALKPLNQAGDTISVLTFTYRAEKQTQSIIYRGEGELLFNNKMYKTLQWQTSDKTFNTSTFYWIDIKEKRLLQSKTTMSNGEVYWLRRKNSYNKQN